MKSFDGLREAHGVVRNLGRVDSQSRHFGCLAKIRIGYCRLDFIGGDLAEVCDSAKAVGSIVGQTDVEETCVFLGNELVQVVSRRAHHHELWAAEHCLCGQLDSYTALFVNMFMILVKGELIVAELVVELVVAAIVQAAEHHAEEDAHVGMVVQRHARTLADEEEYKPVVLTSLDRNSVKAFLEMVRVLGALDAQLVQRHRVHVLYQALAPWVRVCVVQEADAVAAQLAFYAQRLDRLD